MWSGDLGISLHPVSSDGAVSANEPGLISTNLLVEPLGRAVAAKRAVPNQLTIIKPMVTDNALAIDVPFSVAPVLSQQRASDSYNRQPSDPVPTLTDDALAIDVLSSSAPAFPSSFSLKVAPPSKFGKGRF